MSTHRHFRRVKIYVVNSATGKVSPAGRQPPFDGLERNIEVNDRVHAVGVLQSFCLRYRPRETWRTNVGATQSSVRTIDKMMWVKSDNKPQVISETLNMCYCKSFISAQPYPAAAVICLHAAFMPRLLSSVCFTVENWQLVYIPQPRARARFPVWCHSTVSHSVFNLTLFIQRLLQQNDL